MTMIEQIMKKTYDPWGPYSKEHWQKLVIEIISAMREPTPAMRHVCTFEAAEVDWPAMIDAALKEAE